MGNQPIEFSGITPIAHFPKCPPHHPCTQFCESDKLCIPYQKISMDNLREVCLKVCINSFKIICTPAGKKLVIDGKKQIKVFFVPDGCHQVVHSADFEIPFYTFILLRDIQDEVVEICSVVEDITVKFINCKFFTVTSIIFICPVFKKGNQLCPCPPNHTVTTQPNSNNNTNNFDCQDKQECNCHTPCNPPNTNNHHNHWDQCNHPPHNGQTNPCQPPYNNCQSCSNHAR